MVQPALRAEQAPVRARQVPSVLAGEVRRSQDHLAEPAVGRLRDSAAFDHRFQVLEDEIHGLVAPREDRVAHESLDPFDDGGFECMTIPPVMSNDVELSDVLSLAFASRMPKRPVESDRDAAASVRASRIASPLSESRHSRPGHESESSGPAGTMLVLAYPDPAIRRRRRPIPSESGESPAGRGYNVTPVSTILWGSSLSVPERRSGDRRSCESTRSPRCTMGQLLLVDDNPDLILAQMQSRLRRRATQD